MLNFAQLTEDQMTRTETLQAVKAEAFDLVDHLMAPEAKKLADQLEDRLKTMPGLASSAPEIYSQYQKMVVFLRLTALITLENNAVLDLIQNHYLESFEAGLDLNERMTGKMYSIPDLVWPEYTEQIAYALKQNIQKIGQRPITIKGETESKPPTIQSWLSDYDRTLGPDLKTNIEQEEYLAKNPNAKLLSEDEKNKLRNVLQFYNNLKPIPLSVVDKALQEAGVYEEAAKEFPETTPAAPTPPYVPPPVEIVPTTKRYARPEAPARDQYLESVEEEPKTKPAPFVPPAPQRPTPPAGGPSQPAYTRPPVPPSPSQLFKEKLGGQAAPPAPPDYKPPTPTPAPARPTFTPPQPTKPQEPQSSPQMRGGLRRGVENIPSTPPLTPSSSEEGRTGAMPTPQYPPPRPPQQDSYLEPIDIPEIQTKIPPSAPKPPAPPSPAGAGFGGQARPTPPKQEPDPRIQGNIVDLKRDVKDV